MLCLDSIHAILSWFCDTHILQLRLHEMSPCYCIWVIIWKVLRVIGFKKVFYRGFVAFLLYQLCSFKVDLRNISKGPIPFYYFWSCQRFCRWRSILTLTSISCLELLVLRLILHFRGNFLQNILICILHDFQVWSLEPLYILYEKLFLIWLLLALPRTWTAFYFKDFRSP